MLLFVVSHVVSTNILSNALKEIKEKDLRLYRRIHLGQKWFYPDDYSGGQTIKTQIKIIMIFLNDRLNVSKIIGNKQKEFKFFQLTLFSTIILLIILFISMILFCKPNKNNTCYQTKITSSIPTMELQPKE